MNIYALVTQHCHAVGTSDTAQVQKLVGTLRSAGFSDDLSVSDAQNASSIVKELLQSRQIRTAKVAQHDQGRINTRDVDKMGSVDLMDRFIEIEAYIEKGQCPRCHTSMAKVKLGSHVPGGNDFMMANFCSTCRTALWVK